jgi:hypothetical protein
VGVEQIVDVGGVCQQPVGEALDGAGRGPLPGGGDGGPRRGAFPPGPFGTELCLDLGPRRIGGKAAPALDVAARHGPPQRLLGALAGFQQTGQELTGSHLAPQVAGPALVRQRNHQVTACLDEVLEGQLAKRALFESSCPLSVRGDSILTGDAEV